MYLLNLSLLQFGIVFGAISAIALALYLLDRSRRRVIVSTLAFWTEAVQPAAAAHRKRIHQPWSLILQLLSMALLLLAISQLRIGTRAAPGHDHVLLLDTSAWMAARYERGSLMDNARREALAYVRAVPALDRVMIVRADALATPATGFESDRGRLEAAISSSSPGVTALDLQQAFAFARHIQAQSGRSPGEIVFAGAGRIAVDDSAAEPPVPPNLRVLPVVDSADNCGLRKTGARRSAKDPASWEIYAAIRNYGPEARILTVRLANSGVDKGAAPNAVEQLVSIPAQSEREVSFIHHSPGASRIRIEIAPHDLFPADDSAELDLPAQPVLRTTVYTSEPDLLKPVLASNQGMVAEFRKPSEYRPDDSGLVVLDRFIPPVRPKSDSIWIDPPPMGSPARVLQTATNIRITRWSSVHPIAAGLRTRDFRLQKTSIFALAPQDAAIGETDSGPAIVALAGTPRTILFGFHPGAPGLRYELATPLLFANLQRWIFPEMFRGWEIGGGALGMIKIPVGDDITPAEVHIKGNGGAEMPFTLRRGELRFFAAEPGTVRVTARNDEYAYSLTLPQLWDAKWEPPAGTATGMPSFKPVFDSSFDIWPWLAVLGGLGLLLEWLIFGSGRAAITKVISVRMRSTRAHRRQPVESKP